MNDVTTTLPTDAVALLELTERLENEAAQVHKPGPCPSWCQLDDGHDWTHADGHFRPDTFLLGRQHVLVQDGPVLVDASERVNVATGEVTVDPLTVYVDALEDFTPRQALAVASKISAAVAAVLEAEQH